MSNEIDVDSIRKLADSGKRSKIGQLRLIRVDIENVIAAGVSLDRIVSELNTQGMEITLATFKMMLYRLRKEENISISTEVRNSRKAFSGNSTSTIKDAEFPSVYVATKKVDTGEGHPDGGVTPKHEPGEPKKFDWESLMNIKDNWK